MTTDEAPLVAAVQCHSFPAKIDHATAQTNILAAVSGVAGTCRCEWDMKLNKKAELS